MKHLLSGVAMAAALAIAAPVWAQNAPMTPTAPAKPAASAPMAKKPMHHAPMHHMTSRKHMKGQGDQMTEQLNQQELQRIQGGNMTAPPAPGGMAPAPNMMPGGNNPTSGAAAPTAGIGAPPPAR